MVADVNARNTALYNRHANAAGYPGTQCGDASQTQFKANPKDLFASTSGRYAKAAWQHAIAAVPEGTQYRPVTDLVTHESVSSRYGPSEVSMEPSQRRSTTPTLPRPGLNAALCDRVVRRPLTEPASSAVLADAVTQTVCEASAQTVEEEPDACQERVIRIPWGGRPDGSTPVIVPIKEAKALTRCTVRTNRTGAKKGSTARLKKGAKTGNSKQEQRSSSEKHALKERISETWTIPLSPQKAAQPRRHSGKPSRIDSAKVFTQRPHTANAAIPIVKPAAKTAPQVAQDLHSPPRCMACGACSTERPSSAAVSPFSAVQDSPRALQPLPKQPSTPCPTAAALAPISPPQESAPVLPSVEQDSPRSLSVFNCRSHQSASSGTASPRSEHGRCRPPPCQAHACLSQPVPAQSGLTHSGIAQSGLAQVASYQNHSGRHAAAPKASREALEAAVLHNPERQDMVSQLERALADLERDVSQRASEISSEAAPAFNSGLDSLAALEAEITDQHRRLADIGVLLPTASRREPAAVHREPEHVHLRSRPTSANGSVCAVSSTLPSVTPAPDWKACGNGPGDSWPRQNLTGSSSGQLTPSILHSDTQSTISPHSVWPQGRNDRPVASSVSGSELRRSNMDASDVIAYLSQPPTSLLHSDYSEVFVPADARSGRSSSHPGSRPHSASPDGKFSSVSVEDRLTRMGLSEQISQLVRDISAETDSVCSLPQSTQDSFHWLRGVTTNSDTSSTVTLPPLAPPQPLSSRDCLRPSSASPDALSDCHSSIMPSREHDWRSLSASGTFHSLSTSAAPKQIASSYSPPPVAHELTFAPAAFGEMRNLSPQSEASSSPMSSPTVAGKTQSMRQHADDREPPFQVHMRGLSQRDSKTRDSSSLQGWHEPASSTTPCHTTSAYPSTATGPAGEISPGRVSRVSSARSASLNPAAGSSWRGNTEDRESLTSRSQSPDLSTRAPSTHTPEHHKGGGDLSFLSPMTASDLGESASMTATPTDLVGDVESILYTSFWAS